MSKALLSLAAASTLFGAAPHQNPQTSTNEANIQKKVYVYQDTNLNEINKFIEDYFNKMGMDRNITVTRQPAQTPAKHVTQTKQPAVAAKPVQQVAPTPVQPKTTQTSGTLSAYEQKVVDLTNQERAKYGLPALKVDLTLSKMAHEKSRDMSANGYFSHTSPTYGSPFDMMKKYGITYNYAGENIAMGQKTPEEVVKAWMNSEGHRKNILNPNYNYIGVGYVADGSYWTQEFVGK
ncbi:sporulation protein [Bacillus sp. MUM 116]|uniref:CAP domain-containing protein n=1 Tax=Bacillus sp. MUM 116 TaxID=1678002 RepID=UPI0008F56F03|nr:CAP domain-containing protein [Bacillus sp. MUM 116]OIK15780.1 sporulation protein [Bacillus sp. MUM 116]